MPEIKKRDYELDVFGIDAQVLKAAPKLGVFWSGLLGGQQNHLRHWREQHFHFDPSFDRLNGNVFLSGYLQSPRYFADFSNDVRAAFNLSPLLTEQGRKLADAAQAAGSKAIAIHVRRGDYVSDPKAAAVHGTLPLEYYERAMSKRASNH